MNLKTHPGFFLYDVEVYLNLFLQYCRALPPNHLKGGVY